MNNISGIDRIGIRGPYLIGDRAILQRKAPVINRLGDFLSTELSAWNNTVRITAVEVENEERHHYQGQNHRYCLECSLNHLLLEYTGIPYLKKQQ